MTYGQLEQDCLGAWCPVRRIPGLILIHAWNPNDMNTLTSVRVIFTFAIIFIHVIIGIIVIILILSIIVIMTNNQSRTTLSAILCGRQLTRFQEEGERRSCQKSQEHFSKIFKVLQPEVLYTVREGGELSEGETHWLTHNNPVLLPTGQAMMMTLDCGVLCGQVYDGLDPVGHCPHHSSR